MDLRLPGVSFRNTYELKPQQSEILMQSYRSSLQEADVNGIDARYNKLLEIIRQAKH